MTKPPLQILIGNADQKLNAILHQVIQTALANNFTLTTTTINHVGKLSQTAGIQKFDLCILVLDQIETPAQDTILEKIDWVLDFIAFLKAKHRTPVIALSGQTDPSVKERAGFAGADFYLPLPLDTEKLSKTVLKCVKRMGKMPDQFSKPIPPLPAKDQHYLTAAEGWLELGNHLEANEELENITAQLRSHPDVLELRWQIYAKAEKWLECVELGNALVELAPSRPNSWIHRSYALHELSRTEEAADRLLPAADLFPGCWLISYNMACYACRLGNNEEAWEWLEDAFELGDAAKVKLMALEDPDLKGFWAEIGEI